MLVNFLPSPIDDEIKSLLQKIDDVPLESSLRDIEQGYAFAVKIIAEGKTLGLEVCRVDVNHLNEREFVILRCINAGEVLPVNFFDILDKGELELCKFYDCVLVRRHVDRAGMIPALEKYNYRITEVVLKRRVKWEKEARKVTLLHHQARHRPISGLPQIAAV